MLSFHVDIPRENFRENMVDDIDQWLNENIGIGRAVVLDRNMKPATEPLVNERYCWALACYKDMHRYQLRYFFRTDVDAILFKMRFG